eukprot:TRINITY_DN11925_c0_g1_i1.p1 TRINITY_DN11925_c0_g1~~TRINITY_DN11925_c0_g1_i1.p1  ORF type:complete len:598 (+),score=139.71 TRINITY_DN11925_c0_g1_i1:22-1794(+)
MERAKSFSSKGTPITANTTTNNDKRKRKKPYLDMVIEAMNQSGNMLTSIQAVYNYISSTYQVPSNFKVYTRRAFQVGLDGGYFLRNKNSYGFTQKYFDEMVLGIQPQSTSSVAGSVSDATDGSVDSDSEELFYQLLLEKQGRLPSRLKKPPKVYDDTQDAIDLGIIKGDGSSSTSSTEEQENTNGGKNKRRSKKKRGKKRKKNNKSKRYRKRRKTGSGNYTKEDATHDVSRSARRRKKRKSSKRKSSKRGKLKRQPSTTMSRKNSYSLNQNQPLVKLEIVFSFDTTGSMYSFLNELRNKLADICTQLLNDVRGIRIGIIAHGDYVQTKPEPYVIKTMDFSSDVKRIVSFVKEVECTYGCDWPECYELALQQARTEFSWTPGYNKVVVMIGDAIPHKKNEYRKIDWEDELQQLVDMGSRVYAVRCNSTNMKTKNFFEQLASRSDGYHLTLDNFEEMKDMFMGLCYREASEIQYQHHREEIETNIAQLDRYDSAQLLIPETFGSDLTDQEVLHIHNAIHDDTLTSVRVKNEIFEITSRSGNRIVNIGSQTFVEQAKCNDNKYGRMALDGTAITWITRKGIWGLIIDKHIERR